MSGRIVWVPVQVPVSSIQGQLPTTYPFQTQIPQVQNMNHVMPVLQLATAHAGQSVQLVQGVQQRNFARAIESAPVSQGSAPLGIYQQYVIPTGKAISQDRQIAAGSVVKNGFAVDETCEPSFLGPWTCAGAPPVTHYPYANI